MTLPININDIRNLCGYVEDGSNETLKIFQDDATKTWHVKVGNQTFLGDCFEFALRQAINHYGDTNGRK